MPFVQRKLEISLSQTRDIFDKFVYKPDNGDALADVLVPGYFIDSRFVGDESVVEAELADGYFYLSVDNSGTATVIDLTSGFGVSSVTGTAVDNTDPQNPVVDLPDGGPFVIKDQAYVEDNARGTLVNNFNSINYELVPLETQNDFATNPVTALTLVTEPLADGTYTATIGFIPGVSSALIFFMANVWVDGVKIPLKDFKERPRSNQNTPWIGAEAPLVIDDGLNQPHVIEFRFGRQGLGNRSAQLYYANIRVESEVS